MPGNKIKACYRMGTQTESRVLPGPGSGGAKLVKFLTSWFRAVLTVWRPSALYREFCKKPEPFKGTALLEIHLCILGYSRQLCKPRKPQHLLIPA